MKVLRESESKELLKSQGIRMPLEKLAKNVDQAISYAREIGFPVAAKVTSHNILHKTDVGGVRLNISTTQELRKAFEEINNKIRSNAPAAEVEGVLVQAMVPPGREVIVGMKRNLAFGPVIMFGLGGIFVEVFRDVSLRLPPITRTDALEMIKEIRGHSILSGTRGQKPADVSAIADILEAVSQIAMSMPEIIEMDLNPVIVYDKGAITVDAKIFVDSDKIQGGKRTDSTSYHAPEKDGSIQRSMNLRPFFEPRTIMIVGASRTPGKPGNAVLENILANGYEGKVYPVSPHADEILGLRCYHSIMDVPDAPDLAVLIVPANLTLGVVKECAAKSVKAAVIASGGYAELDEKGAELQDEILGVAKKAGMRIMGPNTSGIISTPWKFTTSFFSLGKVRKGPISYIAQTGNFATHTMKWILTGENFGVSRVAGLGNEIDVNEAEALEYLGQDPETKAIVMYLEGFKNGRRFLEVARSVSHKKPIIALKSGRTESGVRAVRTHTASIAENDSIVDAAFRQAGIVRVQNYNDLIDTAKALAFQPIPKSNRVAIISPSGAMCIMSADACERLGLRIADFSEETLEALKGLSPPWLSIRNPVDIWGPIAIHGSDFAYKRIMELALSDEGVDAVVATLMLTSETIKQGTEFAPSNLDYIPEISRRYHDKTVLISITGDRTYFERVKKHLEGQSIPVYLPPEPPFEILANMYRCRRYLDI